MSFDKPNCHAKAEEALSEKIGGKDRPIFSPRTSVWRFSEVPGSVPRRADKATPDEPSETRARF